MASPRFLYLRSGSEVDAIVDRVGDADIEVHEEAGPLSVRVGALERSGSPAQVAVVDVRGERPLSAAARVRQADRHIGLVLLAPPEELELASQRVALSPEVSDATVVPAPYSPEELLRVLEEAAAAASQRRELSGALDAINLRLLERRGRPTQPRTVSERYLAALTRHAPDAIISIDREGLIVAFNDAATRMFDLSAEDAEGRAIGSLAAPYALEDLRGMVDAVRDGKEESRGELSLRRGDEAFVGSVTVAPVRGGGEDVLGAVFIVRDVTVQRRTEERLRQLQKAESLATLAGGVAHDFNNLLVTVMGWADLVMEAPHDEETVREGIDRIRSSTQRATELARQMLAYTGRGSFELERTDVTAVVREMVALLQASVPRSVTLRIDLPDELPSVQADPTQLRQVVLNLVTNAAEALGDDGGLIELRAHVREIGGVEETVQPGTFVVLEVEDDGPGMDAETQARAFDPFFTTKFTGRGLGLAATLGIVRAHGGDVTVDSAPGQGATFSVLLPARDRPQSSSDERGTEAEREPTGGNATVLIVDDEPDVRHVARVMLTRAGYDVLEAGDGREAVDTVRAGTERIDVVLMDVTMPVMGGKEAFGEVRRIDPELPIVFFSGYDEMEVSEQIAQATAPTSFLPKPFSRASLTRHVAEALRAAERGGPGPSEAG